MNDLDSIKSVTHTYISQTLPQVTVDSVLVAVALEVSDNANLEGIRCQEIS